MDRLTNEKMLAVNEYSDTVLDQIEKNHKEAVFLYDMLNDKHENLKTTVSEAVKTATEVKQTVKDAEITAREAKETALEVLSFYNKMVTEKLMPSDFATLNDTAWTELVITDKAFIIPHLQQKIDFFNSMAKKNNPEFKVQAFKPPVANPEKGVSMVERGDIEMLGVSIPDTGRAEGIANAAKFVDWMYTDEAMELVSWGKEGETFEIKDGKKN